MICQENTDIILTVPDIAVHWMLDNGIMNNVQLAAISNVCRKWRDIVSFSLKKALEETVNDSSLRKDNMHGLLLPDMALEIVKRRLVSMGVESPALLEMDSPCFCVAWFHPRGIKIKTVDLSETLDDGSSSDDSEKCEGIMSYNNYLRKTRERFLHKPKTSSEFKTVADEWQGYQNAMDILLPLGYCTVFVRDILDHAATFDLSAKYLSLVPVPGTKSVIPSHVNTKQITKPRRTTFAVRGTTFARPHGYCLCWAHEEETDYSTLENESPWLDESNDDYRMKLYKLKALERREKRRRIRMRDSLPRTCLSTLAKNPEYQGPSGQLEGRRQRCVQFLNAEKNRAVYMRTHPFDCGPIQAPVTMLVVAIATEDGCFVSGLKRRFELGHLYGKDNLDTMVEMSPICIATDGSKPHESSRDYITGSSPTMSDQSSTHRDMYSDDSSMFDNDALKEKDDSNCQCKIQWKQKYERSDSYDDDDESLHTVVDENRVIRGTLGPGRWHLYTAIFDGRNSSIRIDGVDEPMQFPIHAFPFDDIPILDGLTIGSDHLFDMSLCFGEGSDGEGQGSISELAVFKGRMDNEDMFRFEDYLMRKHGIIHGSFGYCHQDVSNVASSFQGDSEGNEVRTKAPDQWQEYKWIKDVELLMSQAPPCSPSGGSIPLRMATRHRSVAWQRCCEVTGKPLRVSRIGSKLSNGSSDW